MAVLEKKKVMDRLDSELRDLLAKKAAAEKQPEGKAMRPAGQVRRHKVVKGDTLRNLAETYYGDPNKWEVIYEANENRITRGTPKEGEELLIP